MRVPIRKPGKYTFQKADPNMTQAKFDELKNKLEYLKNDGRKKASAEVRRLALMGDFSENVAYSIAKGKLRGINQRIIEIEELLKAAVIIDSQHNTSYVGLGNYVTLEIDGKEKIYKILGSSETNPAAGIISHNSPLGQLLLGHKAGDIVETNFNNKKKVYKIIKIS